MVTIVPAGLPGKDTGEGLFPVTAIVKSDAVLFPPPVLITFLITINFPEVAFVGPAIAFSAAFAAE